jgi:dihydroneopterin aldolase
MSDRIRLRGIVAQGVVGVRPEERTAPRELRIDVDLEIDLAAAGASDDLRDTVDYDALARAIRARVAAGARRLVEAVAEDVVAACLADPRVEGAVVTVHKPGAVAGVDDVAVTIGRRR